MLLVMGNKMVFAGAISYKPFITVYLLDNVESVLEAVHVVSGQRPGVDGFNQPDDASLL